MKCIKLSFAFVTVLIFFNVIPMGTAKKFEIPDEIASFKVTRDWAEMDAQELEREQPRKAIALRASYFSKVVYEINTNDDDSLNKLFGETSPLFDSASDDELLELSTSLMEESACPNFQTKMGHTPFERAIRSNACRTAWRMMEFDADCKYGLLVLADHVYRTQDKSLFAAQKKLFEEMLTRLEICNKMPMFKMLMAALH